MKSQSPNSKKDKIIRISFELFRDNGCEATSVNEIAQKSGISKRTIYKAFRTKEEIVAEAVRYFARTIQEEISDFINARSNASGAAALRIFDWLDRETRAGNKRGCFAMSTKLEFAGRNQNILIACDDALKALQGLVEGLIHDGGVQFAKAKATQLVILFLGCAAYGTVDDGPPQHKAAKRAAELILRAS